MLPSNNRNVELQADDIVDFESMATPVMYQDAIAVSESCSKNTDKTTGRWTREEHFRFLEALKMYGKEWKRVQ